MFEPRCCNRTVAWFTSVIRRSSPSTVLGGTVCSTSSIKRGDGCGRLVSFHRRRSRKPRAPGAPGLKKRAPSKCFGTKGGSEISTPGLSSCRKILLAYTFSERFCLRNRHRYLLNMSLVASTSNDDKEAGGVVLTRLRGNAQSTELNRCDKIAQTVHCAIGTGANKNSCQSLFAADDCVLW